MEQRERAENRRSARIQGSSQKIAAPAFSLLEASRQDRKQQLASFGMGTLLQLAGLAIVAWIGYVLPPAMTRNAEPKHNVVMLYDPIIPKPAPKPIALPVPEIEPPPETAAAPKLVEPKPIAPPKPVAPRLVATVRIPVPQPPKMQAMERTELSKPILPKFQPKVQVGAFIGTAPAKANLNLPAAKVQTGGFGDPNGLPGHAQGASHGNVSQVGSFDLPSGPGQGNGSGGAHGAPAVVASAGFGNGNVAAAGQGNPDGGAVQAAGFADAQAMTQSSGATQARPAAPAFDPVEITYKPNPMYTAEALRLRIQGEVLLRVVFVASGRLQILGVSRGLGHGLDEAAVQSAQQIQFKPARRNGQPVDTTATLHILFELAQ